MDTPSGLATLVVMTVAVLRGLTLWDRRAKDQHDAQYVRRAK